MVQLYYCVHNMKTKPNYSRENRSPRVPISVDSQSAVRRTVDNTIIIHVPTRHYSTRVKR